MKPRLLYSVPTGGHPRTAFIGSVRALSMVQTRAECGPHDWMNCSAPVQMSRKKLMQHACCAHLQPGWQGEPYKYLVMHDDDLEIALDDHWNPIDTGIEYMEAHPECGLYGLVYLRESPKIPIVVLHNSKYIDKWLNEDTPDLCSVVDGLPSEPFECAGIGFGFVMVRCDAIRAVQKHDHTHDGPIESLVRFGFWRDVSGRYTEIGEDYDFCLRLQKCGYTVIADPRHQTAHHKPSGALVYRHDEWEAFCHAERHPREKVFAHAPVYAKPGKLPDGREAALCCQMGYQDSDGTWHELPDGARLLYREDHVIEAPAGAEIVTINGMTCVDISATRFANAEGVRRGLVEEQAQAAAAGG